MKKDAQSLALLSGVRRVFVECLDYESTLAAVARLVLPYVGSWCVVDVADERSSVRRLAVIHPDASKLDAARALEHGWPPSIDDPIGAPVVMRTRQPSLIAHVTDDMLQELAGTADNLRALRELGIGSVITVPLIARDSVLGAITFVSDASGHRYDADDVVLAEDLAGIAALALDNARLYRATLNRVEEEAVNKARSEFLATMSHEIRTPLNAILGYAELMDLGLAGPLTSKQRDYIARLRLSGTHLSGLMTDFLDLAKADAGKLALGRQLATTGTAIATAISVTMPMAEVAGIRIINLDVKGESGVAGVPYVGDDQRVRQILINLMANAAKFTPRGGTMTVSSGVRDHCAADIQLPEGGPCAFIRVVDTGVGIPLNLQRAVFEPFVQGDTSHTRSAGGTGLGLTISRRLARLMGGDLTLSSDPSGATAGATFTLWLPTTAEALNSETAAVAAVANERIARALLAGGGYRVYGLAEIGRHVRGRVEEVLRSFAARVRSDPAFPSTTEWSAAEVEDHQLAFLVDVVQSLVVVDETGGVASELYHAGSEIQRLVSSLHGRIRHKQGWTEEQLDHESAIMLEELEALVHRHVPEGVGDVTAALAVIEHLVDQGRVVSARAFRQSAQNTCS
ncbi:MAG: ATP-binding protein [Gemmatimonadota bacterium]